MNTSTVTTHPQTTLNQQLAEQNAIGCLLNCYLREHALPRQEAELDSYELGLPQIFLQSQTVAGQTVLIRFPESNAKIVIKADRVGLLGRCRFSSRPYLKTPNSGWRMLDAGQLLSFMLEHLSATLNIPYNHELLEQFQNSLTISEAFLSHHQNPTVDTGFIGSEQSLLWGHAMHPTPKSRSGVAMDDLLACSPEVGAKFQLYWFKVASDLVEMDRSKNHPHTSPLALFDSLHQQTVGDGWLLYPCHPWEVYTIMANPFVVQAIEQNQIVPVGFLGKQIQPTSSVRTLYQQDLPAFLKFSIHVRLTNCVRKNAWYELESAIFLTDLLSTIRIKQELSNPLFKVLVEPAASTLDLASLHDSAELTGDRQAQLNQVRESFGILYRDNFSQEELDTLNPQLAGSLFAWDARGNSVIAQQIHQLASQSEFGYSQLAATWFERYLYTLLPGVFNYFFHHGVAFEPHLQNTVIGFNNGMPCCTWIRDLEGTKLLPEKWQDEQLSGLSERARQSVYYSRQQGWNRIAYCALVNNVSEAIFHLAQGDTSLEQTLWQALAKNVDSWQKHHGSEPELQGLLQGDGIPSKNNFTTRLMQCADKESGYTLLPSPLADQEAVQ